MRYKLLDTKRVSPLTKCEECHEVYCIQIRLYQDTQEDTKEETSVRTSCACTKEVDPYLQANKKVPVFTNVNKGIPQEQKKIKRYRKSRKTG